MRSRLTCLAVFLSLVAQCLWADPESARIISHIPRQGVESTALRSVGYSKRRHILEIEFMNGAIYRYYEVDPSVYRELVSADSKAHYYDFNIRRKYLSARVKSRRTDSH
jgi:hypothetical protein